MLSALECYKKVRESADETAKAARVTDRSMLTAGALRLIIRGEHVKALETERPAAAVQSLGSGSPMQNTGHQYRHRPTNGKEKPGHR